MPSTWFTSARFSAARASMKMRWPPSARRARRTPTPSKPAITKGLLLDVLGRYDEAAQVYEHMVDLTSHANGAYTAEEKNNRGIFLERLGAVYHEQNKIDHAIAAYQKMIDMGGEHALARLPGPGGCLSRRQACSTRRLTSRARRSQANPKNRDLKLMLAGELADAGQGRRRPRHGQGRCSTNSDDDRKVWLDLAQMDTRLRRWKDAEDALNKADATDHQEGRPHLSALSARRAGRAAKALRTGRSSSSARRSISTPSTPWR